MGFVYPGAYWPTGFWPTRYWHVIDDSPEPPLTIVPDVGWVNGAYALVVVADDNGIPIGELAAEIDGLTWVLNEFGQARLTVPNPGTAAHLMEFGNRLLVYIDNGLPPWSGFIDPPRRWRYGAAALTAYSGERLLTHRVTGRNRTLNATPGAILTTLLKEQMGQRVVEVGRIDMGGDAVSGAWHYDELYKILQSGLFAGFDFHVTGAMENGRVVFRLNLYQRRGFVLPGVVLVEGHNTSGVDVEEQGPIVNQWFAAGAGNGWGDTDRVYSEAAAAGSIAQIGLRQGGKTYSNVRDKTTLDMLTAAELAGSADAYFSISVDALNLTPARFADYDIGDTVGVEIYSVGDGYRGERRVIGRNYVAARGVVETVLL